MDSIAFKRMFGDVAKLKGFERAFGGWFRENAECIAVLDLQKSNYSNIYYLNVKIYIQGIFGTTYSRDKYLVKRDVGDVFSRQPPTANEIFNLDSTMSDEEREMKLVELFDEFIIPWTTTMMTKQGIKEAAANGAFILPAVLDEINRLLQ